MARHRSFSSEFKRQVVLDFLEGREGMRELARRHSPLRNLIRLWVQKYEAGELTDEVVDAVHRGVRGQDRRAGTQGRSINDGSRSAQKRGAVGTPAQRRDLLHRKRPEGISVTGGCRTMKLARSTYYYRSRRAAAAKIIVRDRIVALCDEFPRYGYRRVTAQLKAEGTTINHKTVSRIMRDNGLQVRPLRRFVRTTDSDHNGPIFPNLMREFVPTMPNQL
jgi:transposase-like protein